jgi:hypothetical protein
MSRVILEFWSGFEVGTLGWKHVPVGRREDERRHKGAVFSLSAYIVYCSLPSVGPPCLPFGQGKGVSVLMKGVYKLPSLNTSMGSTLAFGQQHGHST